MAPATTLLTANGVVTFKVAGETYISVSGTFGGGSVAIAQQLYADTGAIGTPIVEATWTAAESGTFEFIAGSVVTVTLTGATAPSLRVTYADNRLKAG